MLAAPNTIVQQYAVLQSAKLTIGFAHATN
jgi:hypothetical protein